MTLAFRRRRQEFWPEDYPIDQRVGLGLWKLPLPPRPVEPSPVPDDIEQPGSGDVLDGADDGSGDLGFSVEEQEDDFAERSAWVRNFLPVLSFEEVANSSWFTYS